jgi:hypothetical protein
MWGIWIESAGAGVLFDDAGGAVIGRVWAGAGREGTLSQSV